MTRSADMRRIPIDPIVMSRFTTMREIPFDFIMMSRSTTREITNLIPHRLGTIT